MKSLHISKTQTFSFSRKTDLLKLGPGALEDNVEKRQAEWRWPPGAGRGAPSTHTAPPPGPSHLHSLVWTQCPQFRGYSSRLEADNQSPGQRLLPLGVFCFVCNYTCLGLTHIRSIKISKEWGLGICTL